jgi:hypothetical protein
MNDRGEEKLVFDCHNRAIFTSHMILSPPSFWEGKENVKSLKKGSMLADANKYYVEIIKEKKKTVRFCVPLWPLHVSSTSSSSSQWVKERVTTLRQRSSVYREKRIVAVVAFYRGYQPLLYFVNSVRVESKELSLRVHVRSARLRRIRARTRK